MKDFGKPYRRVAYWGVAFSESADAFGTRDAINILAEAVQHCQDRDMLDDQATRDALDYLTELEGGRAPAISAFRAALAIHHPVTRRREAQAAYRRICAASRAGIEVGGL